MQRDNEGKFSQSFLDDFCGNSFLTVLAVAITMMNDTSLCLSSFILLVLPVLHYSCVFRFALKEGHDTLIHSSLAFLNSSSFSSLIFFLAFPFNTLVLGFSFFFILHVVREGPWIVYTWLHAGRERKQKNSLSSLKKHKTEEAGTRFQKFKTQQCLSSFVFLLWHEFSPLFLLPSSRSTSFSSSFFARHLPNFVFLLDQNYFFSLLAIFFIQSLNSIPINLPSLSRFLCCSLL